MWFQSWDPEIHGGTRIREDLFHEDQIAVTIRLVFVVDWLGVSRNEGVSTFTGLVIGCRDFLMGHKEIVGFHDPVTEKDVCNLGGSDKVFWIGKSMEKMEEPKRISHYRI